MQLQPHSRLGRYEVAALIGAGGMGEVYRARDTQLGRDVALKVLPAELARNAERAARFQEEARAAGALNHPNIVAVYDAGIDGQTPYIVSELVEGQTLREALRAGPLPVRKAIEVAAQVADGLSAAHAAGIVHRDLKPENVMLARGGRAKILDFGLARHTGRLMPETDATVTVLRTEPGVVLGTAGYMSPEQVRGETADHRSDIFSFGAVLYEILTGRRAFHGNSAVETMSAILKEDPPDMVLPNAALPPALERIVRHCLEKEPENRFQSARDLAFDLQSMSGASAAAAAVGVPARGVRRRRMLALAAAAVVLALAAAYWAGTRRQATQLDFRPITFRRGQIQAARFTADGRGALYTASWDGEPLRAYAIDEGGAETALPLAAPSGILSVSRKGATAVTLIRARRGALYGFRGTLATLAPGGGAPRELLDDVTEADWAPNGNDLLLVRRERIEYPAGHVLYHSQGWITDARFSPKGDRIAFLEHVPAGDDGTVVLLDLAGKHTALTPRWSSEWGLAWSGTDEIWFTASDKGNTRAIYSVTPAGKLRLVEKAPGNLTLRDIAPDGRVLLSVDNQRVETRGKAGDAAERNLSWLDWTLAKDLSADGKLMLFDETGAGSQGKYGVYVRGLDGSAPVRLGDGVALGISPDGQFVLASAPDRSMMLLPTRAGEARNINLHGLQDVLWASFLPGGEGFLIWARRPGEGYRAWRLPLAGGDPQPVTGETRGAGPLSPDGSLIVSRAPEGAILITSAAGGSPRSLPATPADAVLGWAADQEALLVNSSADLSGRVYRLDLATGRREAWRDLTPADPAGASAPIRVLLSRDGKSYVYSYMRQLSALYVVEGLK